MSKEYDMTFQHRDEAIFGLERLLIPKERLKDRLDWLEAQRNRQFGKQVDFRRTNNRHSLRERPFLSRLAEQHAGGSAAEA